MKIAIGRAIVISTFIGLAAIAGTDALAGGLTARIYSSNGNDRYARLLQTRVDGTINFNFGNGSAGSGLPSDNFGIRWTGYIIPPANGIYTLGTCSDDGVRLYVNGELVIDKFQGQASTYYASERDFQFVAGQKYRIRLDYFEANAAANVHLLWRTSATPFPVGSGDPCNPAQSQPFVIPEYALEPEPADIADALAPCNVQPTLLPPDQAANPNDPVTGIHVQKALRLFRRLAGVSASIFDARIKQMSELLAAGKNLEAARIATADPNFYDVTVKHMAAKMSTRDQVASAPLNDFIATYIGVTRDLIDARKLLTGNFLYRGRASFAWADDSYITPTNTLKSNVHYQELEASGVPMMCALDDIWSLSQIPGSFKQKVLPPNDAAPIDHPEPAGLLTSWSFASSHLIAGTNRRAVEKAFEHFLCAKISDWRDVFAPDDRVGRDVTRFPSSDHQLYLDTCKGCHAGMDGFRGAFALWNFFDGGANEQYLKYGPLYAPAAGNANMENQDNLLKSNTANCTIVNNAGQNVTVPGCNTVVRKMNHNQDKFMSGYMTVDNSFVNYATGSANQALFGWSGSTSGRGIGDFGRMLASSARFPQCQAIKVYEEVCKKVPSAAVDTWLKEVAQKFASGGYLLKDLFETIALGCMDE